MIKNIRQLVEDATNKLDAKRVAKMSSSERENYFHDEDRVYDDLPQMLDDVFVNDKFGFVRVFDNGVMRACGVFDLTTSAIQVTPKLVLNKLLIKYPKATFVYTDYPSNNFRTLDLIEV